MASNFHTLLSRLPVRYSNRAIRCLAQGCRHHSICTLPAVKPEARNVCEVLCPVLFLQRSSACTSTAAITPNNLPMHALSRSSHQKLLLSFPNILRNTSLVHFSSNTEPTVTSHVQHRPKSRFRLVNWFYDDIIQGRSKINAFFLYADITKQIDYMLFFKTFNMPDTFNSWFLVTELHVWMLMARLRNESKAGKAASSSLVTALYDDSGSRSKALSPGDSITSKKQIQVLSLEFKATLLVYDEGFIGNDTQLASALWFRFFAQNCDDPRLIELLVAYVRYQMQNLENLSADSMLVDAKVTWKPIIPKI